MNASTKSQLSEIDAHLNRNLAAQAMNGLAGLLSRLPYEELILARPDIDLLIDRFHHKRQRELRRVFERRLTGITATSSTGRAADIGGQATAARKPSDAAGGQRVIADEPASKDIEYSVRLNALRDRHIFQWSTAYRETISYIFKDMRVSVASGGDANGRIRSLSSRLEQHSCDIFQRGFTYITGTLSAATDVAVAKSVSGLQRFIFLVIDSYSTATSDVRSKDDAHAIRAVTSGMLSGIIKGYGRVSLSDLRGWDLLREYPGQWAHAIAFITSRDLQDLLDNAPESDFRTDLLELAVPTQLAIDRVIGALPSEARALPRVGRFGQYPPRFEVTVAAALVTGRTTVRLTILLGSPQTEPSLVRDALAGGATAVVARIEASLWDAHEDAWRARVIDATRVGSVDDLVDNLAERLGAAVNAALVDLPLTGEGSLAISRNVAGDFPLRDPIVRQFYLVQRHSVRRLLNTFAEGTGAHVWCSVRRSGKTTATIDLAGDTDRSVVVIQTMDHQPSQPDMNLFSARVVEVLNSNKALQPTFFGELVSDCSLASAPARLQSARKVLLIDEYETLFGLLNARARQDDWSRYAIVQPLLSQMVAFATSNLLIFLGQRPDAHAILMSQNQLSPIVRQDSFPLFEHADGSTTSEFARFLGKVLAEIDLTSAFIDSVYAESSGHPYLTVNMMVDFCDSLIANRRPSSGLRLESVDFDVFARDRLGAAVLQRSPYYSTFQQMIADSLSESTRTSEPWLHAVTLVLQRICRQHPRALSCSEPRYREIAADVARLTNTSPGQLLQAAQMANFLVDEAGQVRPAIRILGRLAAVSAAEVN